MRRKLPRCDATGFLGFLGCWQPWLMQGVIAPVGAGIGVTWLLQPVDATGVSVNTVLSLLMQHLILSTQCRNTLTQPCVWSYFCNQVIGFDCLFVTLSHLHCFEIVACTIPPCRLVLPPLDYWIAYVVLGFMLKLGTTLQCVV
eukprot:jgi/Chrzof1/4503/Cz14g15220.t1